MADWNSGRDAAYIKPKFVPDEALHGRDDGGGIDWDGNYTQQFGDGGRVTGMKGHLSTASGPEPAFRGGEESDEPRKRAYTGPSEGGGGPSGPGGFNGKLPKGGD